MQKRSIGLTVLGWLEIVVGFLGAGFFLFCLVYSCAYVASYNGSRVKFLWAFAIFLPPVLFKLSLLFSGVGILKLKTWAWKLNIFLQPCIYLYILSFVLWYDKQWGFMSEGNIETVIFVVWFFALFGIFFYLTRPKVKAQFFIDGPDKK